MTQLLPHYLFIHLPWMAEGSREGKILPCAVIVTVKTDHICSQSSMDTRHGRSMAVRDTHTPLQPSTAALTHLDSWPSAV